MGERVNQKNNWSSNTAQQDSVFKLRRFNMKDNNDEELQQSPDINLSKFTLPTNPPFPNTNLQRQEQNQEEEEQEEKPEVNLKSDSPPTEEPEEEKSENLSSNSIQTKLTIGKPGDKYEQEADATAAKVMGMSDEESEQIHRRSHTILATKPKVLRNSSLRLQAKANKISPSPNLESRLGSSKGGGSPLADDVRGFMEPRFGADFGNVRVHNDSSAVQMNKELGAQAFAHGNDIYYGAGKSPGNNELTAHELTHTIQQTGGVGLQKPPQIKEIGEDKQQSQSPLEKSQQEPLKAKQVDNNNSSKANSNKEKSEIPENKPEKESLKAKQIGKDSAEVKPKQNSQVEEKVNQSTVKNVYQNPAEVTNSTATNNVTKTPTTAGGNAETAINGGQESAPVPQEAAPITAENPGQILEQLKNTPPTQAVSTYAQAQTASAQALEKQKQQLQETIPEIPAPTGLQAKESEPQKTGEKVAEQAAITKQAPDDKLGATTSGGEKAKYETSVPEAPPAPPITATQLAGGKVEQEGQSDQALSRSAQNALNSVHLNTSQINTSAGDRPSVDLTGEADLSQINVAQTQSAQEVQAAKAQAAQGINQDFGENNISPKASNETLKANKELSAVAAPGGKGGENPALPGEVVGGLNQSLSPFLREKIGVEQEKYQSGKDKFDTDSTKARTDADQEIGQLTEETKQKQLEKRQLAQTEVAQAKQEWQTELDNAELDYQQKAGKATQEQQQKIGQEKTKGETQAAKHLVEAEQKAEAEKQKADNEAAKKKEEGKKESGGFWGWAKSAAKTLIDGVKQAVNFVYDNLRKAVKAIFEAAKQLAMAAIDLARNAIVGLIKAYGEILKGLVRVVFAAFPGIAKKITAKIDQAINKAEQAVNAAADLLKKGISAALDFLANTLDQLLGLIQDLYNGIFTVIGMIINGELKELLAKIGNLIAAAQAAPPQFETAGLEELLGGNLDESLSPQELSQAATMGINIPTQEGGSTAQAGESDLPSPPWTQQNVGVDAVENNMELSPELVTQLMAQTNGDGEVMLGESNDESRSMESIISEATGQQQQEDGKEQAKNPDDGLSPRQRADIKWQMMKQGIAKWWSENWPLVIGGTTAAIGGFIALNVVTGGAITAALPPIMSVLTPLFAGITIATIGGHVRDYLAKGWEGDIQGGGKSLAKGLAAGAIELVSWLTFKAGGAALKGAKATVRGAKAVARGGIQLAKKATQAVIKGVKYVIQKGKVLFKGIAGSGIGKQFKRLQGLGKGLLERMRFKAFRIRVKNRRFVLEGLINPWIPIAGGDPIEINEKFFNQRAALKDPDAIKLFDQKYRQIVKDPSDPEFIRRFEGFLKGQKAKGGGDLEEGLLAQIKAKKNPSTSQPHGAQVSKLGGLRKEAEDLIQEIDDWIKATPEISGGKRLQRTIQNDLNGVMKKMEKGVDEATSARVEGFENNLKGVRGEFERAKSAPAGTEIGAKRSFVDTGSIKKNIEIDQIRPHGSSKKWINVKKYNLFGVADPRMKEIVEQANMNLRAAKANPVGGQPPQIVFDFPEGVRPEVAAKLRSIELDGMRVQVTGPEIPLP